MNVSGVTFGGGKAQEAAPSSVPAAPGGEGFGRVVDRLLGSASAEQAHAEQAVRDFAMGRTDNLHGVMLAMAKADLSFRLILQVRNRLSDAYQQVMSMQV